MEFSHLFCEFSDLSKDIKLVVDKMLDDTRLKCQFSEETDIKEQVLEYFLQLLKENQKNQDSVQQLSDEDKKKLMQFFGYNMLIKAMRDIGKDREELILPELLGISYNYNKAIIEESGDVKSSYFGSFYNGIPHGEGIIHYSKLGEKIGFYQGIMGDGFPQYAGKMSITINDVPFYYEGLFQLGLPNGEGIAIIDGNATYKGVWNKGVLNCNDGKVIKFTIENGIPNFDVDNKVKVDKEEENTNTSSSYACGFLFDILKIFRDPLSSCMPQKAQSKPLVEGEKYL
jgi:hypothetical protein